MSFYRQVNDGLTMNFIAAFLLENIHILESEMIQHHFAGVAIPLTLSRLWKYF